MSQRLALLIGNNIFKLQTLPKLNTPVEDVADLGRVLRDPQLGSFDKVHELVNEADDQIKELITDFYENKRPTDLLLLYYSGHGMLDRSGILHLAAFNSNPRRPRINSISSQFISLLMRETRARKLILVLDCCYSGAFVRGRQSKAAVGNPVDPSAAFADSGSGLVILTASSETELAWEGDQLIGNINNSIFTHYLVEGIETGAADSDRDGRVTLNEWFDYAADQMAAQPQRDRRQTPRLWIDNQRGDPIVVARHSAPAPPPIPGWILNLLASDKLLERLEGLAELVRLAENPDEALAQQARVHLYTLAFDAEEQQFIRAAALGAVEREVIDSVLALVQQARRPTNGPPLAKNAPDPGPILEQLLRLLQQKR